MTSMTLSSKGDNSTTAEISPFMRPIGIKRSRESATHHDPYASPEKKFRSSIQLPYELYWLILDQSEHTLADLFSYHRVCKSWRDHVVPSYLDIAWNQLREGSSQERSDWQQRAIKIEESLQGQFRTSQDKFKDLRRNIEQEYGLRIEGYSFPKTNCDQIEAQLQRDYSLGLMWMKIQDQLKLQQPPKTAQEIRGWLQDPANQDLLKTIKKLNLSYLELQVLPSEIEYLTGLTVLYLNNNQLTELPATIVNLPALQKLYGYDNQLSILPEAIEKLKTLKEINFNNNRLTELPDAMGSLTALTLLCIENNQIAALPHTLSHLDQLQVVGFEKQTISP